MGDRLVVYPNEELSLRIVEYLESNSDPTGALFDFARSPRAS
jgi:hypothetical protein